MKTCDRCGAPRKPQSGFYCSKDCELAARREPAFIARRFWSKVDKSAVCWLWNGSRNRRGYGLFNIDRRSRLAPRIAWTLTVGAIPDGMSVLHKCDNPPCVNPEHLFLGTMRDNVLDMLQKNRANPAKGERSGPRKHPERVPRGETSGKSKLTDDAVRTIRAEYSAGTVTRADLARRFAVKHTTVCDIVARRAWKHIE
jgi:hypothetical protein